MNSVRSNNLSLKYQEFTPSGCSDNRDYKIWIRGKDTTPIYALLCYALVKTGVVKGAQILYSYS